MTLDLLLAVLGAAVVMLVLRHQRRQDIQHGELETTGTWAAIQQRREKYRRSGRKVWC